MKATTEGVVRARAPLAFSKTRDDLPFIMETQELHVLRSIPITGPMTFRERLRAMDVCGRAWEYRIGVMSSQLSKYERK